MHGFAKLIKMVTTGIHEPIYLLHNNICKNCNFVRSNETYKYYKTKPKNDHSMDK